MENEDKKGWGGARAGAGRKKKDNGVIYAYMSKESVEKLKALAKSEGLTPGEYIEKHLLSK